MHVMVVQIFFFFFLFLTSGFWPAAIMRPTPETDGEWLIVQDAGVLGAVSAQKASDDTEHVPNF